MEGQIILGVVDSNYCCDHDDTSNIQYENRRSGILVESLFLFTQQYEKRRCTSYIRFLLASSASILLKSSLRWSSTGLFMSAGKSAAGPSGKKKIRNNQNNNNNNNNNSNDRKNKKPQQQQQQQTSKLSKKNENKAKAQEKKRPLPPWQIMSSEDTKENIQDEIQRRQDINKGNLPSNTPALTSTITGDVRASSLLLSPTERQLLNWKRFRPERDVESMRFQGAYLDGGGGGSSMPPSMGVPEVAFLGRSNVGKSSLLNRLSKMFTQATSLDTAVVGKTPGATASVNLYILERKQTMKPLMGFVDLPGFGYARLSKDTKESVETAAERYLGKRKELALGILLVDLRRIPSDDDRAVLAALYDMGVPIVVVATKKDKISSQNQILSQMEQVRVGLGLPYGQPLCISSKTGEGVKQLWSIIMDACEDRILELREKVEKGGKAAVVSDDDPESYGTIQLDEEGRFIEDDDQDDVMMEGYEWIQSFARHDNDNDSYERKGGRGAGLDEEALEKMRENEKRQAELNESQKVKNLKKVARKMEREGKL
eukprot:CAMPEP_0176501332 /NCGR_PEP_ID=MMETSP0200_2-20121128/14101_1 /TAXON_ID=947934 /ORGANISM="Chaetoceros sp., Strain GSL56" /LENGTH=541 /DNA_ID=CAMNT_0017900205 /DNA_START=203 /DNA_END=1829 /DNA_ORIENTATION=+